MQLALCPLLLLSSSSPHFTPHSPNNLPALTHVTPPSPPYPAPSLPTSALPTQQTAEALHALPEGVRDLTLADLATQLAEHVASVAAPPAWPGDKGKLRAARCILLRLPSGGDCK